ncbi:hypothetical protein [Streptomyces sp. NPDC059122]|uniref:hypothetical protein n=1 Tax=unclassified Streptomyces TaxID=2593676 RepID=UPI0036756963
MKIAVTGGRPVRTRHAEAETCADPSSSMTLLADSDSTADGFTSYLRQPRLAGCPGGLGVIDSTVPVLVARPSRSLAAAERSSVDGLGLAVL